MDIDTVLKTLFHINRLKRTPRTGWIQHGVLEAENVAAHSYGVATIALILAQLIENPVDLNRVLPMALLHDLAESLTGDLPKSVIKYLPRDTKLQMEYSALTEVFQDTDFADSFLEIWDAQHQNDSAEAQLVHDADKLDLFLQALVYEEQTGNKNLQEFWDEPPKFYFEVSRSIYECLLQRRS